MERRSRAPAHARVSLTTIAEKAGVSVSTVSRIVNGHLNRANPGTVARVRALLDEFDYRPDKIARALRRGESRVIAMLVPNLDNPAMGAIASSTEAALRAAGFVMLMCDTHDEPELQDYYLAAMREQSVEGYIVVSAVASPTLQSFLDRGEPIVLVGRRQPPGMKRAAFVGIDNFAAGKLAAEYLLGHGTVPAVVHTSLASSAIADRVKGFLAAMAAAGIARDGVRIAASTHLQHLEAGYRAAQALVAKGGWPKGVFCVSDLMAYGVYRLANEQRVAVPDDCLIAGVDDSKLNDWIASWLPSVHIPYADYGSAIFDQLKNVWAGAPASEKLLPHRLIDRLAPQPAKAGAA
jgi:LacI family transcriptional regulator